MLSLFLREGFHEWCCILLVARSLQKQRKSNFPLFTHHSNWGIHSRTLLQLTRWQLFTVCYLKRKAFLEASLESVYIIIAAWHTHSRDGVFYGLFGGWKQVAYCRDNLWLEGSSRLNLNVVRSLPAFYDVPAQWFNGMLWKSSPVRIQEAGGLTWPCEWLAAVGWLHADLGHPRGSHWRRPLWSRLSGSLSGGPPGTTR